MLQLTPLELAVALALLEGDKYTAIAPFDYIANLRGHAGYNNVEGAYATNNKIIFWVKDSVLHFDTVEKRANDTIGMSEIAKLLVVGWHCNRVALDSRGAVEAYKIQFDVSNAGRATSSLRFYRSHNQSSWISASLI